MLFVASFPYPPMFGQDLQHNAGVTVAEKISVTLIAEHEQKETGCMKILSFRAASNSIGWLTFG